MTSPPVLVADLNCATENGGEECHGLVNPMMTCDRYHWYLIDILRWLDLSKNVVESLRRHDSITRVRIQKLGRLVRSKCS